LKVLASLLVLAVVAAALGLEGSHLKSDYSELRQAAADLQESEQLLSSPASWSGPRIDRADALRLDALARLRAASSQLSGDTGLRVARALPWAGEQARAVDDLVATGLDAAAADGDLVGVARAYLQQAGGQAKIGARLLTLLALTAAPLADADAHLRAAEDRLQADTHLALSGPLGTEVDTELDRLQGLLPRVDAAATLAQVLPEAMGSSSPRTYLVVLPNPAELRPNGGLSAFIGLVTFARGAVTKLVVNRDDVYTSTRPCFPIPTVLAFYLKFSPDCLDLGDAGWGPDFPTTARLMESMFAATTGDQVDGLISIDPYAISALLKVLGPLNVPRYGTFSPDNLLLRLDVIVNVQSDYSVMSAVASRLLSQLLNAPVSRWPDLVTALQTSASQRHLQLQMRDPALEQRLLAGSAGGALMPAAHSDYLMVADANVSPNKADVEIVKGASVAVAVRPSGLVEHEVDATYIYPNAPVASRSDEVLNGDGMYRDYVRFYVPEDATVTGLQYLLDGRPAPAAAQPAEQEAGKLGMGMYFVLPRGHTGEVRLSYSDHLSGRDYRLQVQKQAGVLDRPTQLQVAYPGGSKRWSFDLAEDRVVEVVW
jgi:hypothetical protein